MHISFEAIGLTFDAQVEITEEKACLTGHPDYWKPGHPPEMEFIKLTHEGKDVSFLLCSDVESEISYAAWAAVDEWVEEAKAESAIARYESRMDAYASFERAF